jgi:hypothetical protein
MTVSTGTKIDATAVALKDGATKLADLLSRHATLKAELEASAADADAAGLPDFAEVFRDMARRLGPLAQHDARATASAARRRFRPPKSADDQPTSTSPSLSGPTL